MDEEGRLSSRTRTPWPAGSTPTTFYEGLKAAGPDFTRQKVVDAVNANTDYTANGLLGGVDWRTAHSQEAANDCVVYSKIEDGKFKPAFGQAGQAVRLLPGPA